MPEYCADIHTFGVVPSSCPGRALDASWYAEPSPWSAPFDPSYRLVIGESASGPWHDVLEAPTRATAVSGVGHALYTHRPGRYLVLQVLAPDGSVAATSDPMDPTHGMDRKMYLEDRDCLRRESLALRKAHGFWGYLAKKAISECPCPDCSDEILGGAPDSVCPSCFGTGVSVGYHEPVPMLCDWSTTPKGRGKQSEQVVGISEVERKTIRSLPFPAAAYKDLWIDGASDERYAVVDVEPVVFRVFPVAQVVSVSLLPKKDPAYRLPIPPIEDV